MKKKLNFKLTIKLTNSIKVKGLKKQHNHNLKAHLRKKAYK